MVCRNCKEEFSNNQSDVEGVCFTCVQRIVEQYFELTEEDCHNCGKANCPNCKI